MGKRMNKGQVRVGRRHQGSGEFVRRKLSANHSITQFMQFITVIDGSLFTACLLRLCQSTIIEQSIGA